MGRLNIVFPHVVSALHVPILAKVAICGAIGRK